MLSPFEYGVPSTPEDAQQIGLILSQCFNNPSSYNNPAGESIYLNRIGLNNFRTVQQTGKIAGGLAILSMGQWYGDACVPMAGIAAVGIAPEYRGSGAAIALLTGTLNELHANGVALSALYPATQRLYRKAGYEQGGTLCKWEISAQEIQIRDYSLPVWAMPLDSPLIPDLYQQRARGINGHLERSRAIWDEITQKNDAIVCAYGIGSTAQPEGYIILVQRREARNSVIFVDWALSTTAAVRRFWTFLADHRSQIDQVRWRSSTVDALTLMLPEQTAKISEAERWMLRVVHVSNALAKRGYPANLETELHLDVQDDVLPDNNGRFILSVANGRGEVTPGGKGDLTLHVRGLSPLYTGLFTAQQLQLMGQLDATESALAIASQLFAGSPPWMADFF